MKIVRHTAPDMRQALRAIREQLGEEAVILSSRRIPGGVEITAAVDFDAGSLETPAVASAAVAPPPAAMSAAAPAIAVTPRAAADLAAAPAGPETSAAATAPLFPPQPDVPAETMGKELQTLRRMLETQLAQLAWNDRTRRAPVHAELLRELTEIGITQDLADHIVGQLDQEVDL